MSVEEDTELKDLIVQKALTPNGSLAKIKAQLRASIFLALSEDENLQKKEPLQNKKVKEQLQSSEGKLMFSLVREFLEYCNLHFTVSVYERESYGDCLYEYEGREKLINELGVPEINTNTEQPLLMQLLKLFKEPVKRDKPEVIVTQPMNTTNDESIAEENNKSYTSISLELESTSASDNSRLSHEGLKCVTEVKTKPKENKLNLTYNLSPVLKSEQKVEELNKKTKSSLSSLADLPPINLNKSRGNDTMLLPSLYKKESKSNMRDIDKLLDAFVSLDGYEEDVMISSGPVLDVNKLNLLDSIKADMSMSTKVQNEKTVDGLFADRANRNDTSINNSYSDKLNKSLSNNTSLLMDTHSSTINSEDFDQNNVDDILNTSASN